MIGITALKPIYNRSAKRYDLDVVENADPILCHNGYLVYDDALTTRDLIFDAKLLQSWAPAKVNAVLAYLNEKLAEASNRG